MPTTNEAPTMNIQSLQYADIDACAHITAAAFSTDRHTIVKQLGGTPFDMYKISRDGFLASLERKTCICVKAVNEKGDIVGHATWGLRGVDEDCIPREGPSDEPPPAEQKQTDQETLDERKGGKGAAKEATTQSNDSGIARLHALEDADMQSTMTQLMPPGTSCMYIICLIVAPEYQSQDVGTALIQYGTTIADRLDIFTWVHSSDQAWKAYAKFGFGTMKELVMDLDEYAPATPGKEWAKRLEETEEGVTEERWGEYRIRWMKRLPRPGAT